MNRVLAADLQAQLTRGRRLADLRDALTRFGATAADQAALASSIRRLDEFFLLVVVGEFNAGKSAEELAFAVPLSFGIAGDLHFG